MNPQISRMQFVDAIEKGIAESESLTPEDIVRLRALAWTAPEVGQNFDTAPGCPLTQINRGLYYIGVNLVDWMFVCGYDDALIALLGGSNWSAASKIEVTGLQGFTLPAYQARAIMAKSLDTRPDDLALQVYDTMVPGAVFILGANRDVEAGLECPVFAATGLLHTAAYVGGSFDGDVYRSDLGWPCYPSGVRHSQSTLALV